MAEFYRNIGPSEVEEFRKLFRYDPDTGSILRTVPWAIKRFGPVVGHITKQSGYVKISHKRRNFQAHRIVWAIFYNEVPPAEIDHINCVRSDNRIQNLRPATSSQNRRNSLPRSASGMKGVGFYKRTGRWRAFIGDGGHKHLGYFDSEMEAAVAYDKAAKELYGEFARLNFA